MKQVMIKVGVVSPFVQRQRRTAARFDRRSSRTSAKTCVLSHDRRFCKVMPVVFLD